MNEPPVADAFPTVRDGHFPAAPWTVRAQCVCWLARPSRAARLAAGQQLTGRRTPVAVVAGLLRYHDTPVGGYDEMVAAVGLLDDRSLLATVPFIAVDSPASIAGGRANWALPKTPAAFDGDPRTGMASAGDGWAVRAEAKVAGPAIPLKARIRLAQRWPDGQVRQTTIRMSGRARPALLQVDVEAPPSLAGWLRPGWHLGAVFDQLIATLPPMS